MNSKKKNRLLWVLFSDRTSAGSRIQGYNIHEKLLVLDYESHVLFMPVAWEYRDLLNLVRNELLTYLGERDVLIIQKIKNPLLADLVKELRSNGVKTIFIDCDLPVPTWVLNGCFDQVICSSRELVKAYKTEGFQNVNYVNDSPEYFISESAVEQKPLGYKCVWFGKYTDERQLEIDFLRRVVDQLDNWTLEIVSDYPNADIFWEGDNMLQKLSSYDVALFPLLDRSNESVKAKSSNRVLQSLALGLVSVTNLIPSYNEVLVHAENSLIVDSDNPDDWIIALKSLESVEYRKKLLINGYQTAKQHSLDRSIGDWIDLIGIEKRDKSMDSSAFKELQLLFLRRVSLVDRRYFYQYATMQPNVLLTLFLAFEIILRLIERKLIDS